MNPARVTTGIIVAAMLFAHPAHAAQPTQAQAAAIRSACPADYQKYCSGVPAGGQASLQCLQRNVASLSSACQTAVNAVGGSAPPPSAGSAAGSGDQPAATAPAASAPAAPVPSDPTFTVGPLSPRQQIFLVRNACRGDFRRLCGNVPLGGGRAVQCLEANKTRLSQACVGAIREVQVQ
jgi:hypothetical protein